MARLKCLCVLPLCATQARHIRLYHDIAPAGTSRRATSGRRVHPGGTSVVQGVKMVSDISSIMFPF